MYTIEGDPTDGALTVLGHKIGLTDEVLEDSAIEAIAELPFDSERKYMAALYTFPDETMHLIIKGAPDVLLDITGTEDTQSWEETNQDLAEGGMRVIAQGSMEISEENV